MRESGNCALVTKSWRCAEKITDLSSVVKLEGFSLFEWNVRRFASPPVAGITKTSKLPYLSDANAILFPS